MTYVVYHYGYEIAFSAFHMDSERMRDQTDARVRCVTSISLIKVYGCVIH